MGSYQSTSKFNHSHMLHYWLPNSSKLYCYFPEQPAERKFYRYQCFKNQKKYKLYGEISINIGNGLIFFAGGKRISNQESVIDIDQDLNGQSESRMSSSMVNFFDKDKADIITDCFFLDLKNVQNCQIHFEKNTIKAPNLPQKTLNHVLVYANPYIYLIGGKLENTENQLTQACWKLNTSALASSQWIKIAELPIEPKQNATPGIINLNNNEIYLFDSFRNQEEMIWQYNIKVDMWKAISLKIETGFQTIHPSPQMLIFQISPVDLLIVSSFAESQNLNKAVYMRYSLDKMAITLMKITESLPQLDEIVDNQGMKNYSTKQHLTTQKTIFNEKVYMNLTSKSVDEYNVQIDQWQKLDLFTIAPADSYNESFLSVCCTK